MKKIGFVAILFFMVALGAVAQEESRRMRPRGGQRMNKEMMAKRMTERQTKRLSLTDVQQDSMLVFNSDYLAQMQALRSNRPTHNREQVANDSLSNKKMDKKEMRKHRKEMEKQSAARMDSLRTVYMMRVKSVLTEEQFAEFEKKQSERPQHGRRPDAPHRGRNEWRNHEADFGGEDMNN